MRWTAPHRVGVIAAVKAYAPDAISGIPTLVVTCDDVDVPPGFMGIVGEVGNVVP